MPRFTLIAGPNGSGKSTLTARLSFAADGSLIDPDAIARELNPSAPAEAAIAAGREVLRRCRSLLASRASFALETTLSGHTAIATLHSAAEAGYETRFYFVALDNPLLNVHRVGIRAARGGHDVPQVEVLRRYARSLANAPEALRIAGESIIFDNSGDAAMHVASLRFGVLVWRAERVPAWAEAILDGVET